MTALLSSLAQSCSELRELRVNDNWLKSKAVEALFSLVFSCPRLEHLNLSDLNMGQEAVTATLEALKEAESTVLSSFLCNYNDVESTELANRCTAIMLDVLAARAADSRKLSVVEFIGCESLKDSEKKQLKLRFADAGV